MISICVFRIIGCVRSCVLYTVSDFTVFNLRLFYFPLFPSGGDAYWYENMLLNFKLDVVLNLKILCFHFSYTYGQPVAGTLQGNICLVQPNMRANVQEGAFCQNITRQPVSCSGCYAPCLPSHFPGLGMKPFWSCFSKV